MFQSMFLDKNTTKLITKKLIQLHTITIAVPLKQPNDIF